MIIVKKPFIYLKDVFQWKYREFKDGWSYIDPLRLMILEKREKMSCSAFKYKETQKTTEDAGYKTFSLLEFFGNSGFEEFGDDVFKCKFSESRFSLKLVKLALRVVRNAEIVLATIEDFPLIIRNEKYNFYLAPRLKNCKLEDDFDDYN